MELEYYGGNCFKIKTKATTLVFDDNLAEIGGKTQANDKSTALFTSENINKLKDSKYKLVIDSPGEFEIGDLTVTGLQARSHMDEDGKKTAVVYQIMGGGQTITILGHVHPNVSAEMLEMISGTDVLVVPIGGNGYTLDAIGAASIIKKSEPEMVVPSQFSIDGMDYEVPAHSLEDFTKIASLSVLEEQASLKMKKQVEEPTGQTQVVILQVKK